MSSKNYGIAVESSRDPENVNEHLDNNSRKTRSNVGYIMRLFGLGMVLFYAIALLGGMLMSYGLIF
jgi:hypothetical protein